MECNYSKDTWKIFLTKEDENPVFVCSSNLKRVAWHQASNSNFTLEQAIFKWANTEPLRLCRLPELLAGHYPFPGEDMLQARELQCMRSLVVH